MALKNTILICVQRRRNSRRSIRSPGVSFYCIMSNYVLSSVLYAGYLRERFYRRSEIFICRYIITHLPFVE